jgi:ABC-type transport system substrate-binding protein
MERAAWQKDREGGKMKDGAIVDTINAPTVIGRLSYLFNAGNYGNYPDIKALWDQYLKEASFKPRKDLLSRIQTLVHDKTMFIPLTTNNSPAAFGPKVKGNPYKIQPLIWFTAPLEDIELNK